MKEKHTMQQAGLAFGNDDPPKRPNTQPRKNVGRFIAKIQLSQMPYHERYVVYNADQSIYYEDAVTPEILKLMNDNEKGFVLCSITGTILSVDGIAPRQDYQW